MAHMRQSISTDTADLTVEINFLFAFIVDTLDFQL
jgi:hypothetical protein